jgi:hypothetical protein
MCLALDYGAQWVRAPNSMADRLLGRIKGSAAACLVVCLVQLLSGPWGAASASAQELTFPTYVIDISQGSELSELAKGLGEGGYELSAGTPVVLADWYRTDWPDTHIDMLTQLGDDFGILWGYGTGEQGEKYRIDPSLRVGIIAQAHPKPNSVLSLTIRSIAWGNLTEDTCEADYGDIGGVQTVNCRLAASELPPAETLQYLADAEPSRLHVSLTYSASF